MHTDTVGSSTVPTLAVAWRPSGDRAAYDGRVRILILYASLGSGHISAANAIAAQLEQRGAEVRSEDALEYTNPAFRSFVTTIITRFSQEAPSLYRALYEGTDDPDPEKAMRDNDLAGSLQAPLYADLTKLIEEYQPDRIICAQQLPALVVRALSANGTIDVPSYIVITDYMAHSSWIISGVDGYFVAWDGVAEYLRSWGIPDETIHVTGIPVKAELAVPKDPDDIRARYDIADGPVILAIASGVDTGRFTAAVAEAAASLSSGTLVVVAGRNHDVVEALGGLTVPDGVELRVLGFVDYLDDLVVLSDVVVGKSGGLITTEVLARGTPFFVIDPFPGQEEWNADFVSATGAGASMHIPTMAGRTAAMAAQDPAVLDRMGRQAMNQARPEAASTVADIVLAGPTEE